MFSYHCKTMWCRSPYIRLWRICGKQHVTSENATCIRKSLQHRMSQCRSKIQLRCVSHYPFRTAEIITNKKPAHIATTLENAINRVRATVLFRIRDVRRTNKREPRKSIVLPYYVSSKSRPYELAIIQWLKHADYRQRSKYRFN